MLFIPLDYRNRHFSWETTRASAAPIGKLGEYYRKDSMPGVIRATPAAIGKEEILFLAPSGPQWHRIKKRHFSWCHQGISGTD